MPTIDHDKLFVYGSLNDDYHLQLITGRIFTSEKAVLHNYRRIHPKSGYPFALAWRGSKIEGRIIYDVTPADFEKIDDYESVGNLYERIPVKVWCKDSFLDCQTYIGKPKALKPFFSRDIESRDRIEEHIENRVNQYVESKTDQFLDYDRDSLPLRVTKELLSEEVHSLVRQYFHDVGLPAFIIKHEIEKASTPSLEWLQTDQKAQTYFDSYMRLSVKFMIFNQLEEKFRRYFRSHVKVADAYYLHTISAMMALKLMEIHRHEWRNAWNQLGLAHYEPTVEYVDYAVAAIYIAEQLFTLPRARNVVDWVRANRRVGTLPLGAELEFSNLGVRAIKAAEAEDAEFDSFYYFYDFDLMRRAWKLGGHVDDHGFLTSTQNRTRGFLELAFGRYKLLGDVSKPATQDGWILSQLISLATHFIEVRPHSLHISLQTPANTSFQKITNPEYFLCLLLLGGDLRKDTYGKMREMRIYRGEILHPDVGVFISRLNRHHTAPDDTSWNYVIEYQFPRLYFDYDYQPLIMALKGFQLEANPYPFKEYKDCPYQELHDEIETSLIQWAAYPTPVSQKTIDDFLIVVEKGLDKESRQLGTEYTKYVQRILGRIEEQLKRRNKRVIRYHDAKHERVDTDSGTKQR